MKITKDTHNFGTLQFSCRNCGVEFEAEYGEYNQCFRDEIEEVGRNFFYRSVKYTPSICITIACPKCGLTVSQYFQNGKSIIVKMGDYEKY